jgi:hypothetical protein
MMIARASRTLAGACLDAHLWASISLWGKQEGGTQRWQKWFEVEVEVVCDMSRYVLLFAYFHDQIPPFLGRDRDDLIEQRAR